MEGKNIHVWQAEVLANRPRAVGIFELVLSCSFAKEFGLGQFLCLEPLAPESVMARPFSVYTRDLSKGTISLLVKVVGNNTRRLSQLVPGQEIKAWGPLGRTIRPRELSGYDKVFLVGGGVGIAALSLWQNEVFDLGISNEVFYGNKTGAEAVSDLGFIGRAPIHLATDDGSLGFHGLVTDLFAQKVIATEKTLVLTCGPKKMMCRIAEICRQKNLGCWVSLERTMACGLGVCYGCSIETDSGGMQRICCEGPVFSAKEVSNELQARS